MIYKVELIDEKFPLAQSEASKSSIDDILDEAKSLKYQITIKTELKLNFLQFISIQQQKQ